MYVEPLRGPCNRMRAIVSFFTVARASAGLFHSSFSRRAAALYGMGLGLSGRMAILTGSPFENHTRAV